MIMETIKEYRQRQGSRFLFLVNFGEMLANAEEDIIICVDDESGILETVNIEVNSEFMSWQAFQGVVYSGGTTINAIPRNLTLLKPSNISVVQGATVSNEGISFTAAPINIVAQTFRNNSYYLNQDIISSDFNLAAEHCYLFRIKNTSGDTIPAQNLQFTISTSNN